MTEIECESLTGLDATIEETHELIKCLEMQLESIRCSIDARYAKGDVASPAEKDDAFIHKTRQLAKAKAGLAMMKALRPLWTEP